MTVLFFLSSWGGVRLSPHGMSPTLWSTVAVPDDDDDDDDEGVAVGWKTTGWGNRSTQRKLAPVPLCSPQIPYDLTRDRTQAASVGSPRLTAWALARPKTTVYLLVNKLQASYGTQIFITVFARTCHRTLACSPHSHTPYLCATIE
jgi:hypothetical protein